jgi:hypothetical protein
MFRQADTGVADSVAVAEVEVVRWSFALALVVRTFHRLRR